jgi:hypothetical protein
MPLLAAAFEAFRTNGQWPRSETVQHQLDTQGHDTLNVQDALKTMPRRRGYDLRLLYQEHATIPVHCLRYLDAAQPALNALVGMVQIAVADYFAASSPGASLTLNHDDPRLVTQVPSFSARTLAAHLLDTDLPNPIASGNFSPDNSSWSRNIYGDIARRMKEVRSLDDYINSQDEIVADLVPPPASPVPAANAARRRETWYERPFQKIVLVPLAITVIGVVLAAWLTVWR